MNKLSAVAEVLLEAPHRSLETMCAHFIEHDWVVTRDGYEAQVTFPTGLGRLEATSGRLIMHAEANDESSLCQIRHALASHLIELAGDVSQQIVWTGDASELSTPPNFREVHVKRIVDLTSRMRRITFEGEDLARFDAFDLHLKILLPQPGATYVWPMLGRNGLMTWPEGAMRPDVRTYTIRHIDVAAAELDVDFVVHTEHGGPGSRFAQRARPGDRVGILGPGGRNVQPAEWYLLAGDETALPAIARILSTLPSSAHGIVLLEVDGASEHQPLRHPPGIALRWLDRNGARPGTTALLPDAVMSVDVPRDRAVFAWAGTEFSAFRMIRSHWRRVRCLTRDQHLCVSYWRLGHAEDGPSETEAS